MTGSIEQFCMYYDRGECHLHGAQISPCRLCFNYATGHRIIEKGKTRPFYTLYDYLVSNGDRGNIFPSDSSIQTTL